MIKYLSIVGLLGFNALAADQASTMTPPNGSQLIYSEAGAQIEKRADGSKTIRTKDGTEVEVKPDGSKTIKKPDGTVIEVKGTNQ